MNNVKNTIGWCDWTVNPVKGLCPVGCPYCYARRAYGRNCNATFRDKSIRYEPLQVFKHLHKAKPGDKVFVGSTIDLFHPDCSKWNKEIIKICASWPELTFIFLTKCPHNLCLFSPFPDNCWVGVSVTSNGAMTNAYIGLIPVSAPVKFVSFEPLLGSIGMNDHVPVKQWLDWVIIGAQTPYSQKTAPRIEWVKEITDAAGKANIPVFLKNNLNLCGHSDLFYPEWAMNKSGFGLRQEFGAKDSV